MKKQRFVILLLGLMLFSLHTGAADEAKDPQSDRTKAAAEHFKANINGNHASFFLALRYHGEKDPSFRSLMLTPARMRVQTKAGWRMITHLDEKKANRIIDHLADSSYFDRARDISEKEIAYPKGPAYTLSINDDNRHYYADLGWNLDTYRTIEALGKVLDDVGSKAIQQLLEKLEMPKKGWLKAATGKPSTTVVNGLEVSVKPGKAVYAEGEALQFDVGFKNISDEPLLIHDLDFFLFWDFKLSSMDGGDRWIARCMLTFDRFPPKPTSLGSGSVCSVKVELSKYKGMRFFSEDGSDKNRFEGHLALPHGTYKLVIGIHKTQQEIPLGYVKQAKHPFWTGKVTTKPVVFSVLAMGKPVKGLTLGISTEKKRYAIGDDIPVTLSLTNNHKSMLFLDHWHKDIDRIGHRSNVWFEIRQDGMDAPAYMHNELKAKMKVTFTRRRIDPGDTIKLNASLNMWYDMRKPGKYTIVATYTTKGPFTMTEWLPMWEGKLKSNVIKIEVLDAIPNGAGYPTKPGTYSVDCDDGKWIYKYVIAHRGTRSEKRRGRISINGKTVAGRHGDVRYTPFGKLLYLDLPFYSGWLNTLTYDSPVFDKKGELLPELKETVEMTRK